MRARIRSHANENRLFYISVRFPSPRANSTVGSSLYPIRLPKKASKDPTPEVSTIKTVPPVVNPPDISCFRIVQSRAKRMLVMALMKTSAQTRARIM